MTGFLLSHHAYGRRVSLAWFLLQPTNVLSSSSSLMVSGIKEDTSLLNEGFLQAKPEKPVAAQKPRSHFPTPAPVSAWPPMSYYPWGLCLFVARAQMPF